MGINFEDGYNDLMRHFEHEIVITNYHDENVAIECETCHEVLLDFTKGKTLTLEPIGEMDEEQLAEMKKALDEWKNSPSMVLVPFPAVPESFTCKNCGHADAGKMLLRDFDNNYRCPDCCSEELTVVLGTTPDTKVRDIPDDELEPIPEPSISGDTYSCPKCSAILQWDARGRGEAAKDWFMFCGECGWKQAKGKFCPGKCGPSDKGEEYCACGCDAYSPCEKDGCPHCTSRVIS